ncbi:immunoglobulin-like domain-containing protein [Clostridium sp. E02]|uniref:immunoglobulin-like domain-containing protein n=1 Tax=Clostridium sp. E02 TaxID=2487134 RepID=UPI000F52500F|nr:immunoglobulin-like domain-containing protein [Clostridium sp. E02]
MKWKDSWFWRLPVTKSQVACVAGGFLLYVVMEFVSVAESRGFTKLERAGPGHGENTYEVVVSGLDPKEEDKEVPIEIPVRERIYTDQEAKLLFDRIEPELKVRILGENPSLSMVRTDLKFQSSLDPYGLRISWETDNPDLIDSFGEVHNENLEEKGETVLLTALVTDGTHNRNYNFKVLVFPPELTRAEKIVAPFKKLIEQEDLRQQTKEQLILPDRYAGHGLRYSKPKEKSNRMLPLLGMACAVLLHLKGVVEKQEEKKEREKQLLFDYSEVISKLVVYIGAGLTIRGAWERIVTGYEEGVKQKKRSMRPAYDEMVKTAVQIGSGVTESRAYSEFGRRCGLQPYIKLSALLEQSRKNGGKQLRSSLELEMVSAFEQRKNYAKKLGEEAGTKLLFPLLMMLGVVMIMIVVPVFLAFY